MSWNLWEEAYTEGFQDCLDACVELIEDEKSTLESLRVWAQETRKKLKEDGYYTSRSSQNQFLD